MNSLIFNIIVRFLNPILWVMALWLLYRGHNAPGGGFIAGLIAASTVIFKILSTGWLSVNPKIRNNLFEIAGIGIATSIFSGFLSMMIGNPFMTGRWNTFLGLKWGTPMLFDLGVFIVVFAVTIICTGFLLEEDESKGVNS